MLPVVTVSVILVGMLCVLDLILTLGVIRRLREHTALLSTRGATSDVPSGLAVGDEVGEFEARTVDGENLNRDLLADDTLVAFFSPHCAPCQRTLPKFVELASLAPGGRGRVLAVVTGEAADAGAFVADLAPVAQVVVESDPAGALSVAFKVQAFPLVMRLALDDAGRLVVSDNDLELDRLAAVAA